MPVGQESPTLGMGVWAKADTARSKMEQSRYLVMVISPGWCLVSICEVETFWFRAGNFREYGLWHSAKIAKSGFGPFGAIDVGGVWDFSRGW